MKQRRPLDETLAEVVSSLGDSTRRSIYLALRDSDQAQSVAAVAELFDLHPNVARYHLDQLVEARFLRLTRASTGPGAGRPAHLYAATEREIHVDVPRQNLDLLAELLIRVLERAPSPDSAEIAYDVGFTYGEEFAPSVDASQHPDLVRTVEAAADVMRGLGFDISAEASGCEYQTIHCPFGKVALEHPRVVCALDRGLVAGLMQALGQPADVTLVPHTTLGERCITTILPSDRGQ